MRGFRDKDDPDRRVTSKCPGFFTRVDGANDGGVACLMTFMVVVVMVMVVIVMAYASYYF
jgi:hypothetical protein